MASASLCRSLVERLVAAAVADFVVRFGGGREAIYAGTASTSSTTVNLTNGNSQTYTLTSNTTITLAGATAGTSCTLSLYLVQDGTGSRTVTWPAGVKWPGGTPPTLSTAASSRDLVVLESIDGGATWYGTFSLDFS